MAYIYKITNNINGKVYIGKTNSSLEKRFKEHCSDCLKYSEQNRPLYSAMKKYGVHYFSISLIEETNIPVERERYWIQFYNSYGHTGYNATLGGDGTIYLNHEKIIKNYQELQNIQETACLNSCSIDSVSDILKSNNIPIKVSQQVIQAKYGNKVQMIDKNTLEILQEFLSQKSAAQFLIDNHYSNIKDINSLASKISLVCRGKRKTCSGFIWKYA